MRIAYELRVPSAGKQVSSGPDWLHEIKLDGYPMLVIRENERVRSENGTDWTRRFPWIVETARKIRKTQFIIDGEAVVLRVDRISDFNALHSRRHDEEVQLDVLALDGEDLRKLPLSLRKTNLARLLCGRPDGIFVAPFEQGEIGPDLLKAACNMGLEGMVSKPAAEIGQGGQSNESCRTQTSQPMQ
jgi:ATP-dependent DNA ligase